MFYLVVISIIDSGLFTFMYNKVFPNRPYSWTDIICVIIDNECFTKDIFY